MQLSQIAKTVQLFGLKKVEKRHAGTWLSRSPLTKIGNCRYAWLIRPCITRETRVSSLVVDSGPCYHPLLYTGNENGNGSENWQIINTRRNRNKRAEKNQVEVLHLFRCSTHTHTRKEWIIILIRQELNPVTCKLDRKQINLRRILRIMEVLLNDLHDLNRHQKE